MPTILKKALGLVLADNTRLSRSSQSAKPVHAASAPKVPKSTRSLLRLTRKDRPLKKLTERELIQLESEIGATIFGDKPDHVVRRTFFNLDKTTWIWHEEVMSKDGKPAKWLCGWPTRWIMSACWPWKCLWWAMRRIWWSMKSPRARTTAATTPSTPAPPASFSSRCA